MCSHIYKHAHAHTHTCIYACMHAHTHTHTHMYTHTHARTHARTRTHTYTHSHTKHAYKNYCGDQIFVGSMIIYEVLYARCLRYNICCSNYLSLVVGLSYNCTTLDPECYGHFGTCYGILFIRVS